MTLSLFRFYGVTIIVMYCDRLRSGRFSMVFAESLQNVSTDFYQTYCHFSGNYL